MARLIVEAESADGAVVGFVVSSGDSLCVSFKNTLPSAPNVKVAPLICGVSNNGLAKLEVSEVAGTGSVVTPASGRARSSSECNERRRRKSGLTV